jgi:tetratricopeptide (TPR) repeat protein
MMHNLEEITLPDSVSIQSPNAAIMESVSGLGEIQFSGYGEKTLFHVPMETWMLTPSAPGTLSLGAAQVKIMGLTRVTGKSSISVKALPESVSKTGAVGDFKYSLQLPEPQAVAGDTVQLKIRVEGVGNLNYMVLAEPVFPDSLTVVKKENAEFKADNFGFTGYRELQYSLTLEEKGSFRVEIPGFSWLNPQTGKVSVSPSSSLDFEVVSLQDSLSSKNLSYPLLSPQEVLKGKGSPLFNSPQAYFFLLLRIGPFKNKVLLSSLFLSLVMTSGALLVDQDTQGLNAAQVHFDKGEYKEALEYYKSAIDQWDNNAAYLYNKGVLHYFNNENAASIASLRTALYLKPTNNQIRNTLKSIERSLSLDHQFELTLFLAQDILFILFVLSVNSLFILLALSGKRHRILSALFVFLFILSGMVSGVELIRSSWLLNRKEAVIRQDIAIRKIPNFQGSPWITIPEGTSVELIRNYKGFILVHTAYGLEGWIPLDKLIRLSKGNSDEI